MTSEKQLAANRRNAELSTGPRTPEGKAAVRFNAVQHALTGQFTVVAPPERAAFDALSHRLTADLKPSGEQQLQIAARIVRDTWRLSRVAAHLDNAYAVELVDHGLPHLLTEEGCSDPDAETKIAFANTRTFFSNLRDFNLAGMYEQRIHRTLMKDYALLRQLQQDRRAEEDRQRKLAETKPVLKTRAAGAAGSTASNGFVFSPASEVPKPGPQPVDSDLPQPSRPAKTPPQAQTEAPQAA